MFPSAFVSVPVQTVTYMSSTSPTNTGDRVSELNVAFKIIKTHVHFLKYFHDS